MARENANMRVSLGEPLPKPQAGYRWPRLARKLHAAKSAVAEAGRRPKLGDPRHPLTAKVLTAFLDGRRPSAIASALGVGAEAVTAALREHKLLIAVDGKLTRNEALIAEWRYKAEREDMERRAKAVGIVLA